MRKILALTVAVCLVAYQIEAFKTASRNTQLGTRSMKR